LPVSATEAMNPAFDHAKAQLLRPFRFGQWARLAFVGLLAGELGGSGGGGGNFHIPRPPYHLPHPRSSGPVIHSAFPNPFLQHPALTAGTVFVLVLVGLVVIFLLAYVGSVMRFILFDSVLTRECHIREGWAKHSSQTSHGWDLFVWQIAVGLVSLAFMLVVLGVPIGAAFTFGWFNHAREHLVELVLGGGFLLIAFLLLIVAAVLVHVITKDFVVPQMALENITATEGWRRLWASMQFEKGEYVRYIVMKIVLAIAVGIAETIVTFIGVVILLMPLAIAAIAAIFGGKAAGLTWNAVTISIAVVAGMAAFAALMFVVALIHVPTIVYFPAYAMYFFAPRYAPLAAVLWSRPATLGANYPPPFTPPVPPPTPAPLG
jgi:hypothetical protein